MSFLVNYSNFPLDSNESYFPDKVQLSTWKLEQLIDYNQSLLSESQKAAVNTAFASNTAFSISSNIWYLSCVHRAFTRLEQGNLRIDQFLTEMQMHPETAQLISTADTDLRIHSLTVSGCFKDSMVDFCREPTGSKLSSMRSIMCGFTRNGLKNPFFVEGFLNWLTQSSSYFTRSKQNFSSRLNAVASRFRNQSYNFVKESHSKLVSAQDVTIKKIEPLILEYLAPNGDAVTFEDALALSEASQLFVTSAKDRAKQRFNPSLLDKYIRFMHAFKHISSFETEREEVVIRGDDLPNVIFTLDEFTYMLNRAYSIEIHQLQHRYTDTCIELSSSFIFLNMGAGLEILTLIGKEVIYKAVKRDRDNNTHTLTKVFNVTSQTFQVIKQKSTYELQFLQHIGKIEGADSPLAVIDANSHLVPLYSTDLYKLLNDQSFSPTQRIACCRQLVKIVHGFHSKDLAHRGIKEANICVSGELGDSNPLTYHFVDWESAMSKTMLPKYHVHTYALPVDEVPNKRSNLVAAQQMDVFALATVLYHILEKIKTNQPRLESIIKQILAITDLMDNADPSQRLTMAQVLEKMESIQG